jgi:hypothetical protein
MAEADCEGGVHACVGLMSSSHVQQTHCCCGSTTTGPSLLCNYSIDRPFARCYSGLRSVATMPICSSETYHQSIL